MKIIINCALSLILTFPISLQAQEISHHWCSPVIPKPVHLLRAEGTFSFTPSTTVIADLNNSTIKKLAICITDSLSETTGLPLNVVDNTSKKESNFIALIIDEHSGQKTEEYNVTITSTSVTISASITTGAWWGFQTVRQLLQPSLNSKSQLTLPCMTVQDYPHFKYRGLMLDVSRHFFPIAFIKKYIDLMSFYKLNTFHWHLCDDQGWRIEIKKYPKLQEIASYRNETLIGHGRNLWPHYDSKRYGGYYTQEEVKEIVEYARLRHIIIIPEIELPGHCMGALAAHPELGCTGGPYKTATRWGIFSDVYCAGNEKTFEFLKNVLTEIVSLFPSTYIHIGGDEVHKKMWSNCPQCQKRITTEKLKNVDELQNYFVSRITTFLAEHNRRIIGWDEILEGGLPTSATIMSWRGIEGGIKAARSGHDVIMTPARKMYFDHYQSRAYEEPLAIGGHTTLKDVYDYDPVPPELNADDAKHILGAQANVWTEYIQTPEHVEYMTLPRALALAEICWTPAAKKNYEDFICRVNQSCSYLKSKNVSYSIHGLDGHICSKSPILTYVNDLLKYLL